MKAVASAVPWYRLVATHDLRFGLGLGHGALDLAANELQLSYYDGGTVVIIANMCKPVW